MKLHEEQYDVGVIIGRFQVPELHSAHKDLIEHVRSEHGKVIIFLGLAPIQNEENPLDFESRKQMILASYPDVNVLYIKDVNSDTVWSKRLDGMVGDLLTPSQTAVLYGGRDSFIDHYSGKHATRELEQSEWISGSELRKGIGSRSAKASADWREGAIWQSRNGFPLVVSTVDIVVFNSDYTKLLLAQKPNENQWRCIGGFTDPQCDSDEEDVRREVYEEAQISVEELSYVGSYRINDWRYKAGRNKVRTHLFTAIIGAGQVAKASDDIAFTKWFFLPNDCLLSPDKDFLDIERDVMPEHRQLVTAALQHLGV